MKFKKTGRNFDYAEFRDGNDELCVIQKSSVATEDMIWLGIDDVKVKQFKLFEGWTLFALPSDVHVFGRMHLTRDNVKELLPILERFVETGEIT